MQYRDFISKNVFFWVTWVRPDYPRMWGSLEQICFFNLTGKNILRTNVNHAPVGFTPLLDTHACQHIFLLFSFDRWSRGRKRPPVFPGCNAQPTAGSLLGIYGSPWMCVCSAMPTPVVSPQPVQEPLVILWLPTLYLAGRDSGHSWADQPTNQFFSKTAWRIFSIFCMRVPYDKDKKCTRLFFKKKSDSLIIHENGFWPFLAILSSFAGSFWLILHILIDGVGPQVLTVIKMLGRVINYA